MPKQKVSKYTQTLRELGFKRFDELLSAEDSKNVENAIEKSFGFAPSKFTRAERRKLVAQGVWPYFGYVEDCTYAMDETGTDWKAEGQVDLSSFGFSNLTHNMYTVQSLGLTPKKLKHRQRGGVFFI